MRLLRWTVWLFVVLLAASAAANTMSSLAPPASTTVTGSSYDVTPEHPASNASGNDPDQVAAGADRARSAGIFPSLQEFFLAAEAGAGADNVVNAGRLAQQLTREEASSVFTESGELQPEVIAQSREIINGTQLGNKQLVSELTSNGSDIADWGKYTTPPSGVHLGRSKFISITTRR